jgi:hypothetical protein
MAGLKLAKLPDRTPVKLTISLTPELHSALRSYAGAYREVYQSDEKVETLVPAMLELFLASDKHFAKSCKTETGAAKEGG